MAQTIQFRRGLEANRTGITPSQGEPIYTTDDKKLYIGDGATAGGVLVGSDGHVHSNKNLLDTITDAGSGVIISGAERNKLNGIEAGATADQVASEVPSIPAGNLAATDVQAALNELQNDVDTRIPTSQKGAVNGVASLDASGLVPNTQIPPLAITMTHVVADIPARDALTVQEGDVAIVTSTSQTFIYDSSAWQEILTPATGVTSFNGRLGAVTPAPNDYSAVQVSNTPAGNLAAATVQAALNELQGDIDSLNTDTHMHANKAILDLIPALGAVGSTLTVAAGGATLEWTALTAIDGGTF